MSTNKDINIGKFTLDSLTSGMYNNPLCIFREYIQNSADAIDEAARTDKRDVKDYEIRIIFDQPKECITIKDDGCGVSVKSAAKTLLSLGDSQKFGERIRGFRGIGRLGGHAYCDTLLFKTKSKGENEESHIIWYCDKLHQLLARSNPSSRGMQADELIKECTEIKVVTSDRKKDESFFIVEMCNVKCSGNILWDLPIVRQYIEDHAPVPFDNQAFFYGKELDTWLHQEVPNYNTYRIFAGLTNSQSLIMKRYTQTLALQRKGNLADSLEGYKKFDVLDREKKIIARGWYGIRKDNIGQLASDSGIHSLRVRVGNILLGEASLTDQCFSETRFNDWIVGEIHVISPALVPNARRDDFEDSDIKSDFYKYIREHIAAPLAKKAREDSDQKSKQKPLEKTQQVIKTVSKQLQKGFVGDAVKNETLTILDTQKDELEKLQRKTNVPTKVKEKIDEKVEQLEELRTEVKAAKPSIAETLTGNFKTSEKELIRQVLEIVYEIYDTSQTPQELIDRVIKKLNRKR
jgi:molecular chaperone HtpG